MPFETAADHEPSPTPSRDAVGRLRSHLRARAAEWTARLRVAEAAPPGRFASDEELARQLARQTARAALAEVERALAVLAAGETDRS